MHPRLCTPCLFLSHDTYGVRLRLACQSHLRQGPDVGFSEQAGYGQALAVVQQQPEGCRRLAFEETLAYVTFI